MTKKKEPIKYTVKYLYSVREDMDKCKDMLDNISVRLFAMNASIDMLEVAKATYDKKLVQAVVKATDQVELTNQRIDGICADIEEMVLRQDAMDRQLTKVKKLLFDIYIKVNTSIWSKIKYFLYDCYDFIVGQGKWVR